MKGNVNVFGIKAVARITIKEQLIKYGYFPEELPDCYTSEDLYDKFDNLILHASEKEWSECCNFTISKKSANRRQIRIPNPEQQIRLIEFLLNNKKEIKGFIDQSQYTQSNPFQESNFRYSDIDILDIPRLRNKFNLPSKYVVNIIEKVRASMGYKYKLKLDLSNFYDSIYTHTLEWASKGREKAKQDLRKRNKKRTLEKN